MLKTFALLLFAPLYLIAQITPKEGSALNYRIIGFSFQAAQHASNYKIQVAPGNYYNEDSFQKNIVVTATAEKNKIIAEVPFFGRQYTWRSVYLNKSKTVKSELHHFSAMMSPDVDADSVRLRMITPSEKYKDDYVFVDGNKVLYDMKGQPVWFFPKIEDFKPRSIHLRDLKLSPFGTITVIIDERIYEINYNGDVLWKGPGNDEKRTDTNALDNSYHHEFTRLGSGHYMVMSFEQPWWQLPYELDSTTYAFFRSKLKRDNNVYYQKMLFGSIIEYDQHGDIVWKWSGSDYIKGSDLSNRMTGNRLFDVNDTHANAFYFDEKTKNIYISFRDINRIIKIQYPGGKVLNTYGTLYSAGNTHNHHLVNGMYCGQHSCRLSDEGYLYLFNNNICHRGFPPTILMLKEPQSEKDTLTKVWEFECPMDEMSREKMFAAFNFGGNVIELPDRALFVCMGGTYGKVFIVDRDKKILWCGQPEKWDQSENRWTTEGLFLDNGMREGAYRSSIISRNDLESLIWNEPLNNGSTGKSQ